MEVCIPSLGSCVGNVPCGEVAVENWVCELWLCSGFGNSHVKFRFGEFVVPVADNPIANKFNRLILVSQQYAGVKPTLMRITMN